MAKLVKSDLDFILNQIKISESHANGTPIRNLIPDPQLQWGLRTVDGSHNNILPGQEQFGAADRVFPRLTPANFRDADAMTFDPDGPSGPQVVGTPTSYNQTTGDVFDAEPRLISNLISDQTADNPAALAARGAERIDHDNDATTPDQVFIPNVAPDAGLSAPYNSWFTLFGQFFDHGLDLVAKGGNGTVFMPLATDDPLYNPNSPQTNFMVLTRATNTPAGVHESVNTTTPWIDQNQTYTSHASHQAFLREYTVINGSPIASGKFLDGENGGLATWGQIKEQARLKLGINLTDADVTNVPLLATDEYGRLLLSSNGSAQLVVNNTLVSGNLSAPISTANATRTGHAFLDDIAHTAATRNSRGAALTPDGDSVAGGTPAAGTYDNELLDAHFATGDGRGNENIGLTAVHTIFHAEHNRLVEQVKAEILATGDMAYINEWLRTDQSTPSAIQPTHWDGERLFQAARFGTEMQYQHLVFEEFARKVTPAVNLFAGYQTDIDPAITAEFAHTVYRFGHSMLTETVDRTQADGSSDPISLLDAFLNPLEFSNNAGAPKTNVSDLDAAGAIVRGMTGQVGNEMDEFVTDALRSNLLGLPLDLAALNIARGRDQGIPSLNAARRTFFNETGDSILQPYESWADYGLSLRNAPSLINFIAAYGTHETILNATTMDAKRDAAVALVTATATSPTDRLDFMNGTGRWDTAAGARTSTGLDDVDFWIGGLAEKQMAFGSLLGSTFSFVFEVQMEKLQDADRLYYLHRTPGMTFATELEENSFAELIENNLPGVQHLPGDVFSTPAFTFELKNLGTSGAITDDAATPYNENTLLTRMPDGTVRYAGEEHVVFGGTDNNDRIRAGAGDDTIWGDGGNDRIEGGDGADHLFGGVGNDIITDEFGDDVMKGGDGNDVLSGGAGIGDLLFGSDGSDFIIHGNDGAETMSGNGNDFVRGGAAIDTVFGGAGDDWIEGGGQADLLQGDNGDPFQLSEIVGNDVMMGTGNDDYDAETGDDIMAFGQGIQRAEGMLGFDWVMHKGDTQGANTDMLFTGLLPEVGLDALRDRMDLVEGLSGWNNNDILRGDDSDAASMVGNELTNVSLINGLQGFLGGATQFTNGNIIMGGAGEDIIEGRGGNDLLDGDAWLNARLSVRSASNPAQEIQSADSMSQIQAAVLAGTIDPGQVQVVREIISPATPPANTIDVAQYSDNFANYDVTVNANGSRTVNHARGTQADGVDTIRNFERLQFADQVVVLNGQNLPGSGTVTISDTTPAENQSLTVTGLFSDPNLVNTASIQYFWQTEVSPDNWVETGGVGTTFQPGDPQVGHALRVMATFQDQLGAQEVVFSAATAAVTNINDAPSGAPVISDTTPTVGQAITADITGIADDDGMLNAVVSLQWQSRTGTNAFANIAGATAATFTPTSGQAGAQLRVVARFTDNHGTAETVISAATTAVGGATPPPPTNTPATGTPTINDVTPVVGQVLTASPGTIADANGLPAPTAFTYQWQSGNGTTFTNIAGATGSTFTVTPALAGTQLRVIASFTDGNNNLEQRVSDPTTAVPGGTSGVQLIGDANANTLNGTAFDDDLQGRAGNDTLNGLAGNDALLGEDGLDLLSGGTGADRMTGGAGDDTYVVDQAGDVITELAGGGTDTVRVGSALTSYTLIDNVESMDFQGTTQNFTGIGNAGNNWIRGRAGADTLTGNAGNDTLIGLEGIDTLNGGAGNDRLDGGTGADRMTGGTGNDVYLIDNATDVVTEAAAAGTDTIETVLTTLNLSTQAQFANVEHLTFTSTAVTAFTGTGNALGNTIQGGAGNDALSGLGGDDRLVGNAGNDTLTGGTGNDFLVFATPAFGTDRIIGFDADALNGQDRIDVAALGITAANFGTRVNISDTGADVSVTLETSTGAITGSIVLVGIASTAAITASDFLLGA